MRPVRPRPHFALIRSLVVSACVAACVSLDAGEAHARAADDSRGRPWARGTAAFGLGLGGGGNRDLMVFGASVSGSYYVFNGIAVGLEIDETYLAWRSAMRSRYPQLDEQIPSNLLSVTPTMRFVPLRSHRFSPFVMAGLGPTFLNHQAGVLAHWVIMPGASIGLGSHAYVSVGVRFTDDFPAANCQEAFTYEHEDGSAILLDGFCGFRWAPHIGVGFAF